MSDFIKLPSASGGMFLDISGVKGLGLQKHGDQEVLVIYAEERIQLDYKSWKIDLDVLRDELSKHGKNFIPFEMRVGQEPLQFYFPADAVVYATIVEDKQEDNLGVIMGVRGIGRIESYGVTHAEWKDLSDELNKVGKVLNHYGPDVASARWHNATALYIDPKAITRIRDDGYQVNVTFGDTDMLDIQTPRMPYGLTALDLVKEGMEPEAALQEMLSLKLQEENSRRNFAQALADAHGGLTQMPSEKFKIFIQPEEVRKIYTHDKDGFSLSLEFAGASSMDRVSLSYPTLEQRDAAVRFVTQPSPGK